jgi:phospholipase C
LPVSRRTDRFNTVNGSRDNLPNPIQLQTHPYVPVNAPTIGDVFDAFEFPRRP